MVLNDFLIDTRLLITQTHQICRYASKILNNMGEGWSGGAESTVGKRKRPSGLDRRFRSKILG
ncbi:MAG: hypothetical protein CMI22_06415 [Opitutae bacterium]|nr:hypothetical protein [Opitutae bacterium]